MQEDSPLISIVLPVFNGEKTLKATLVSLLTQTYSNFELLIGIDGTKDGSKVIAESFGDPRIKLIEHPQNLGLAENVNKLVALADKKTEFIAMAEQDDIYVSERLQWQVEVLKEQPEVGLISGIAEFVSENNKILFPGILVHGKQFPQAENLFRFLYVNQLKVVNTCMMFRKSVHQRYGLRFNNTYGNFNVDWDYVLRFSLVSKVYGIPKVLVTMNRSIANNSVTRDKTSQHKASRLLLRDFREEFPEIISTQFYKEALKQHRKIEIGHQSKTKIVSLCLAYSLRYCDDYFLKYLGNRIKKYKVDHFG
ncbi:glycosyltransferase family 2 protein [Mangrovimonas aestuarii]|uniref:glycosyltransferase family 2 protein n=1 Tax=Mangrovimonas aestuarii TaxID=3018443 RepID=UPI0023786970|nr:glycosyltransferase [Mangrovimonas aestuarii]